MKYIVTAEPTGRHNFPVTKSGELLVCQTYNLSVATQARAHAQELGLKPSFTQVAEDVAQPCARTIEGALWDLI